MPNQALKRMAYEAIWVISGVVNGRELMPLNKGVMSVSCGNRV